MVLSDIHTRIAAIRYLLLIVESLSMKTDRSIQLVTSHKETLGLVSPLPGVAATAASSQQQGS